MNNHKKCIMAVAVVEGVPVPVIIMAMATATGIVNFLKLK